MSDLEVKLWQAIATENEPLVVELIKAGANSNTCNAQGHSPLLTAVEHQNLPITQTLLQAGGTVNQLAQPTGWAETGPMSYSPLMMAAEYACTELVELLLAAKAELTLSNELGNTALTSAIESGRPAVVEQLLTARADPTVKLNGRDIQGEPIMFAVTNANLDITQLLLTAQADPNSRMIDKKFGRDESLLAIAVTNRDLAMVQLLLAAGADPNLG